MAEFPAFPLWTDAYLADTTHLTTFEHGAYLLLLMVSWRSRGCCLPDDDALLARYAKTTPDKWRKLRPVLAKFFAIKDGAWHQARLQDEFQLCQSRKIQQIKAGNASAQAKALKRLNRSSTSVDDPLQRNVNEAATPTPTILLDKESNSPNGHFPDAEKFMFDAGIDLLTHAGKTETAARSIIGKWKKEQGVPEVIAMLGSAQRAGAIDPVSYIQAGFRRKASDDEWQSPC
jgi:uncharacterized protein YdaU (DUF1376 family)